jgi:hypothetical protein
MQISKSPIISGYAGDILNGNRLMAEIKFRIGLKWSVSVRGKAIDLETRGSQEPVIAHLDQSCFQ